MNDDELKQLFARQDTAHDDSARDKALKAAMAAFDEAQAEGKAEQEKTYSATQGSATMSRLIPDHQPVGRKAMNTITADSPVKRWTFSALASAAVLVLGVFITLQMPWQAGMEPAGQTPPYRETRDDALPSSPKVALEERAVQAEQELGSVASESHIVVLDADASASAQAASAAPPPQVARTERKLQAAPAAAAARVEADGFAVPALAARIDPMPPRGYQETGRDRFEAVEANPVKRVSEAPVSTFSIDVDTAAYSFVRRQLNQGVLPQKAAVRVEEMINYFPYDYPAPHSSDQPFDTHVTLMDAPWKPGNKLVHIGIQGYEIQGEQPRSNLVFLLDVSGSMNSPDKLPLVKQSMGLLLSRLQPEDTVSIVVYAGAAGTVLEPTPAKEKQKILDALNRLQAGGSTAGAAGIQLAYQLAESQLVKDGVNRIILATDGDFNVGINNREELKGFVERKRESGVFLSVLGFGQGNYHDALMQTLAQNGNGVAAYIDTLGEAQKVLVHEATSALFPIAKDVKIQVEFNPATVSEYRLLGYETRLLKEEDFNNDAVDAGDIGAGHSVTAIYEITPVGSDSGVFAPSRYRATEADSSKSGEYGFLKLRYKLPDEDESRLITQPIEVNARQSEGLVREARFATAVAGFAELLRGGKYSGDWTWADALGLAQANRGDDPYGYRAELVQLIRKAEVAKAM
ncbi:VWA domain-containing protein [Parahaliea maris]|uniref:VWA domain-containing protein n=1 Tax=Parahaliea maris TaxID=2716870 RepID=A0A5C9A4P2_9GAMM|nr:VWA domain-containing protein [Parahaliea maris]TXS94181.1 VWA domain-containing protein [Parahaliea maris]